MDRYLKDEPKMNVFKKEPSDMAPWEFFTAPGPISGSWSMKVDSICLDEFLNEKHLDTLSMSSTSSSCSGKSWDSSLSCAVVVKKERIDDDYEDSDSNDEKLDKCNNNKCNNNNNNNINNKNNINININNNNNNINNNNNNIHIIKNLNSKFSNSIELLIARTPASSPLASNSLSASALSSMLTPNTMQMQSGHDILPTLTPPSSPESSLSKCNNNSSKNLTIMEPELAIIDNQGIYRVQSNGTALTRNTIVRLTNSKNTVGLTRVLQMNSNFQNTVTQKGSNSLNTTGNKHIHIIHTHETSNITYILCLFFFPFKFISSNDDNSSNYNSKTITTSTRPQS